LSAGQGHPASQTDCQTELSNEGRQVPIGAGVGRSLAWANWAGGLRRQSISVGWAERPG